MFKKAVGAGFTESPHTQQQRDVNPPSPIEQYIGWGEFTRMSIGSHIERKTRPYKPSPAV
jgi:hypothetical protein